MGSMLYMGIHGSILITGIMGFRHFFSRQVPKRFLVLLWICAIIRLLVPVSIPVRLPAADCRNNTASEKLQMEAKTFYDISDKINLSVSALQTATETAAETVIRLENLLFIIWLVPAVLLASGIIIRHLRSCRLYSMSLPLCEETASRWLQTHHSFRKVNLQRSERIRSPLTYGIIHPVILLPSEMNLSRDEFECIMEHE